MGPRPIAARELSRIERSPASALAPLPRAQAAARPGTRALNLHEYQSMQLMRGFGVPVPRGEVADSAAGAEQAARRIAAGACARARARDRVIARAEPSRG